MFFAVLRNHRPPPKTGQTEEIWTQYSGRGSCRHLERLHSQWMPPLSRKIDRATELMLQINIHAPTQSVNFIDLRYLILMSCQCQSVHCDAQSGWLQEPHWKHLATNCPQKGAQRVSWRLSCVLRDPRHYCWGWSREAWRMRSQFWRQTDKLRECPAAWYFGQIVTFKIIYPIFWLNTRIIHSSSLDKPLLFINF